MPGVRIGVVLALLSCACGGATASKRAPLTTCGSGWSPLTIDRAPEGVTGVVVKESGTIDRIEVAGVDPHFAETMRRELTTKPGMDIVEAPLGDDLKKLFRLGVVEDASVEFDGGTVRFVIVPRKTIHEVTRVGGDTLAQARFRQLEDTTFEPARLRRMADALRDSYVREGRLDAQVEARQRTHERGVDVCVAIEPGPRITISKLEFPGRKAMPKAKVIDAMTKNGLNRVGKLYDEVTFEHDELLISALYWDHGYANVRVRPRVITRKGKHVEIAVPIEEGPIFRIGKMEASSAGIPIALPKVLPIKPGDLFSRSKIVDARTVMEQKPGAGYVLITTKVHVDKRTIDLHFEIEWRYPWDALRFWLSHSR
jgi:outer membrane protein insertion porin family